MIVFPERTRSVNAHDFTDVKQHFETDRFAFASNRDMRQLLAGSQFEKDWPAFAASWRNLEPDRFMADGGHYRNRRHCVFRVDTDGVFDRLGHQSHHQLMKFNIVNGGIDRWFAPVEEAHADSLALRSLLNLNRAIFCNDLQRQNSWRVEVHQIRIKALGDMPGKPTPEGLHRDGVDYVFIMLVGRQHAGGGITTITDLNNRTRATFHLTEPLEALFLDDTALKHIVSPIWAVGDASRQAHRDALIVTWKRTQ